MLPAGQGLVATVHRRVAEADPAPANATRAQTAMASSVNF